MAAFEVTVDGLVGNPAAASALPQVNWAAAAGTANAITAAYTPANTALVDGLIVGVRCLGANTVTNPTFAPDGLTPHTITFDGGSPLEINNIPGANFEALLRYNLANTRWELLNPAVRVAFFKGLVADDTGGTNVNTAQPWFPTAGGVTLPVGTYRFKGILITTRAAGTTSHTTSLLFAGTATLSSISYDALAATGDANSGSTILVNASAATATQVKAASTSATEFIDIEVDGFLTVTVAGTFIPQFQYSVAPGGAPTVKAGTFFLLEPFTNPIGTWA